MGNYLGHQVQGGLLHAAMARTRAVAPPESGVGTRREEVGVVLDPGAGWEGGV